MTTVVTGVAAFATCVVSTPVAMRLAQRLGVVDRPGPLKPQGAPVPYLGGVAVFLGAAIGAAVGRPSVLWPLLAALVLGVLDDRSTVPAWARLVAQVGIGLGLAAVVPVRIGGAGGGVLVVVMAVALMNGVNFVDGLDGLAAGTALVGCGAFAALLTGPGRDLAVALVGGLAGFLLYNRPPARIYLGDGGAYLLGASLAALLAWSWAPGTRWSVSVSGLLLVAVPLAEVGFAVVRRARAGHSVTAGDRRHPYDLMVARGWSPAAAALAYVGVEALCAGAALGAGLSHTVVGAAVLCGVGAVALVTLGARLGALSPGPAPGPEVPA